MKNNLVILIKIYKMNKTYFEIIPQDLNGEIICYLIFSKGKFSPKKEIKFICSIISNNLYENKIKYNDDFWKRMWLKHIAEKLPDPEKTLIKLENAPNINKRIIRENCHEKISLNLKNKLNSFFKDGLFIIDKEYTKKIYSIIHELSKNIYSNKKMLEYLKYNIILKKFNDISSLSKLLKLYKKQIYTNTLTKDSFIKNTNDIGININDIGANTNDINIKTREQIILLIEKIGIENLDIGGIIPDGYKPRIYDLIELKFYNYMDLKLSYHINYLYKCRPPTKIVEIFNNDIAYSSLLSYAIRGKHLRVRTHLIARDIYDYLIKNGANSNIVYIDQHGISYNSFEYQNFIEKIFNSH